jgi:Zn-dependent protease with chaperone function
MAGRAALAVVLMAGFYTLAIGIAGGLIYLIYADWHADHRFHLHTTLFCALGAGAILWSMMPRSDAFQAPGPRLAPSDHPRLFEEIAGVARATRQEIPAEVYLVHDVNAWVAQRGGLMGLGSRRVMGLGLPLMQLLPRAQFRAVLAHEFGHYHGGDTRLGPLVYRTRNAISRTLSSISATGGEGSLLRLPFLWYGRMFLRITHAVSRHQEFVADELAARTFGSKALADGLRTVHGAAPAFEYYWSGECEPVLGAGFRPPLLEGFQHFLRTGHVTEAIRRQLEEEMKGESSPYDSHPPISERIRAVEHLPPGESPPADPAAITLLDHLPALELELLQSLAGMESVSMLQPLAWRDVGRAVYLPQWSGLAQANARALAGLHADELPAAVADRLEFVGRFVNPSGEKPAAEHAPTLANATIGAALAVLLVERGLAPEALPGMPVAFRAGPLEIYPFEVLESLALGHTSGEAWKARCRAFGIDGAPLHPTPRQS